jgi:hypothetical protein
MGKVHSSSRDWDEEEKKREEQIERFYRMMERRGMPIYGKTKEEDDRIYLRGVKKFFRRSRNGLVVASSLLFLYAVDLAYKTINSTLLANHQTTTNYAIGDLVCSAAFLLTLTGAIRCHYKMKDVESGLNAPQSIQ